MIRTSFIQAVILFILIVLGFVLTRIGTINEERKKGLSDILLDVVTPLVIINALQTERTPDKAKGLLLGLALSFLYYVLAALVAHFYVRKKENLDDKMLQHTIIFQNCGYMGIPFIQGVFGTEAVFYVTPMLVVFNLFVFTFGLVLLRKDHSQRIELRSFLSPAVISIVIGSILFFAQIRIPYILAQPIEIMTGLNTPLGMLIAGAAISTANLKDKKIWGAIAKGTFGRLLLVPLIYLLLVAFLPIDPLLRLTMIVLASCPTASVCIMMAIRCERDEELAAEVFAVTTILSMFTMPLFIGLASALGLSI